IKRERGSTGGRERGEEEGPWLHGSEAGRKSHVVATTVPAWNVPRPSRFPAWLASKVLELWRERSRRRCISWSPQQRCSSSHHPGAIIVASRSRYSSVAPLPPCLNSAFHDKDSDIVAWYNPGARPKRPTPRLGRAPRRRLFEARRLEIKRGARALA
ncbi:hypothetical protein B296_00049458, partial [Ensete ventricosum]